MPYAIVARIDDLASTSPYLMTFNQADKPIKSEHPTAA
jgi:hypothetical protein